MSGEEKEEEKQSTSDQTQIFMMKSKEAMVKDRFN